MQVPKANPRHMERIDFPRHADAPQRVLFFTMDQIIPFSGCFVVGMAMDQLPLSILAGVAATWFFSRFTDSTPDGYLNHAAFWHLGFAMKGRAAMPHVRRIFP